MCLRRLPAGLLGLVACATAPPQIPELRPAIVLHKVDYRGVFGGRASSSIYDPRVTQGHLMDRVLLEPTVLAVDDAEKGIEAWTLRKLLQPLGKQGSRVIAPPPPSCDAAPCYAAQPTAAFRNLRFISGGDTMSVRVLRDGEVLTVRTRFSPKEESLCPPDFKLRARVVQLVGQLQALPDGAVAAAFQELRVVESPDDPVLTVEAPDPGQAPEAFCAAVAKAYDSEPGFAATDARFELAAQELLSTALGPVYPPPDQPRPK